MTQNKIGMEALIQELQTVSGQISSQTRTLALSTIAMAWALLIGKESASYDRKKLLIGGVFALTSLILDYMQYASGYLSTDLVREECARAGKEVQFDYTSIYYKIRQASFWLKQAAMIIALIFFLGAVIQNL